MTTVKADKSEKEAEKDMQILKYAQHDMRLAYLYGYSGVVVSGVVWLVAGFVAIYVSPGKAIWALLIGGALIHPMSILLNKLLGARGTHAQNNPLGRLAMESTVFMLMCLPLAYGLSFQEVEWFFQAMLLIIGGRYFMYATLYGTRAYWVLGTGLGLAAYLLFILNAAAYISILSGAVIELTFGLIMLTRVRNSKISSIN